MSLGIQDVQGYDASHLGRYDAYLVALNGHPQNYHDAEIFESGLNSPLLDLLNVRYVLVPAGLEGAMTQSSGQRFTHVVYQDGQVSVLENASSLPRAWIVHTAEVAPPQDALQRIAAGQIDARQTALLEQPAPPLEPASIPTLDRAFVVDQSADHIALRTVTDSAGLLVVSEVYYPAWKAYVDGQPSALYAADGALRAVAVAAGEHEVELRYESGTLAAGLAISILAASLLALLASVSIGRYFRRRAD